MTALKTSLIRKDFPQTSILSEAAWCIAECQGVAPPLGEPWAVANWLNWQSPSKFFVFFFSNFFSCLNGPFFLSEGSPLALSKTDAWNKPSCFGRRLLLLKDVWLIFCKAAVLFTRGRVTMGAFSPRKQSDPLLIEGNAAISRYVSHCQSFEWSLNWVYWSWSLKWSIPASSS